MGSNSDWDSQEIFHKYLHDYLVKKSMHKTAAIFAKEANADLCPVAIDSPQGFLVEWWSIFYDVFFSMQPTHEEAIENASNKGKQVTGTSTTAQKLRSQTSKFEIDQDYSAHLPIGSNCESMLLPPASNAYEQPNRSCTARNIHSNSQFINTNPQNRSKPAGSTQSNTHRQPRKQAQQRQDKKRVAKSGSTPMESSLRGKPQTLGTGNVSNLAPLKGRPLIGASQIPPHLGLQVLNSYLQSANNQPQVEMPPFRSQQELFAHLMAGAAAKALYPVPISSDLEMLLRNGLDETSGQDIEQIMGPSLHQNFSDAAPFSRENVQEFGLPKSAPEGGQQRTLFDTKAAESALDEEERLFNESIEMFLSHYEDEAAHISTLSSFLSDSSSYEKYEHTGLGISFVEVGSLHASKGKVLACNFSPDGKFLACAGQDKKVLIWNTDTLGYTSTLESNAQLVTDVQFHPSSKFFATSSFDRTVQLWDAAKPSKSLFTLVGHNDHVMSLDFHPRKMDLLCSCDSNDEIRLWNVKEYTCLRVSKGGIKQVRFQPQLGRLLATAAGNAVNIFDVETGDFQCDLKGHGSEVRSICWDATGKYIASVSEESVRLWSIFSGGRCLYELHSEGNNFHSCTFHPRYPLLLIISSYQSLSLWNPSQSNTIDTVQAHDGLISSLAGSIPTGLIASASHDQCVKLWR